MTETATKGILHTVYFLGPSSRPGASIKIFVPADVALEGEALERFSAEFDALEHLGVDETRTAPGALTFLGALGLWELGQQPDQAVWSK